MRGLGRIRSIISKPLHHVVKVDDETEDEEKLPEKPAPKLTTHEESLADIMAELYLIHQMILHMRHAIDLQSNASLLENKQNFLQDKLDFLQDKLSFLLDKLRSVDW